MSQARPALFSRAALSVVLLLAGLAGCAGYQVGSQTLFPSDIRTVYVPMFESNSLRPFLGERLTEAVVKQIEATTPYKVVSSPAADSVLSGRITQERKGVLVKNQYDDVREYDVNMTVEVSWLNRRGDLIGPTRSIPLPADVAVIVASSHVAPEYGRSITTGQQETIDKLARQIVALMEVPW